MRKVQCPVTSVLLGPTASGAGNYKGEDPEFSIIREEIVYQKYMMLISQDVKYPNGKVINYDVTASQMDDYTAVTIFPFCTKTKTTTLLREYCPGPNAMMYSLPGGGYDKSKHRDLQHAAECELSEEAQLRGGTWVPLMASVKNGVAMGKSTKNRFVPWLVLDPEPDPNPMAQDYEEFIMPHRGIPIDDLQDIIFSGEILLTSCITSFVALEKLRSMSIL
eukprot:CAMPEP_0196666396 /NCGR_PEP_ID=MMETSP1086-20130531/64492_1 /TAXON_ID=77921 /ORGANISM="Cyanoptyche  gloeocystis , Strain SAG4.97" /LENGTH=219 /DNA_ID=CAMNT_0042003585 /DNA_START=243 /DNA_END=902 /DNA_ORIENTATION=-